MSTAHEWTDLCVPGWCAPNLCKAGFTWCTWCSPAAFVLPSGFLLVPRLPRTTMTIPGYPHQTFCCNLFCPHPYSHGIRKCTIHFARPCRLATAVGLCICKISGAVQCLLIAQQCLTAVTADWSRQCPGQECWGHTLCPHSDMMMLQH